MLLVGYISLWVSRTIAISITVWKLNFLCAYFSPWFFLVFGPKSPFFLTQDPPKCFYCGYLNLRNLLSLTPSIGTKFAKSIGWWFYMVAEMYIMDPENQPVM